MSDELTYAEHSRRLRDLDRTFYGFARDVLTDQPKRTRLAALIAAATIQLVNRLPNRLRMTIHGDNPWQSRVATGLGATVCRLLGHRWVVCTSGRPERGIGHLLLCQSCSAMPSTDDPDYFMPGRDRRDFAAVAYELDQAWGAARYCHPVAKYRSGEEDAPAVGGTGGSGGPRPPAEAAD